jgi:methylmalonyl-CoA/ethylmalonyl-CoA epimerase
VYYVVPDLDAPHLVARMPDHEPWMAFCRDSEQNLLALMSEVRPDAAG